MQRAEARGQRLPYAAARAALWLLDDFPAHMEALLFPDSAFAKVGCEIPRHGSELGFGLGIGSGLRVRSVCLSARTAGKSPARKRLLAKPVRRLVIHVVYDFCF